MELGELSRAIGKPWSILWPKVRKQEERKDVGRALSPEEESRLLAAAECSRSPIMRTLIRVALLTGMRSGEITALTWGQVDFVRRMVTVGRAKTSAGTGRQIPMNDDLFTALSEHAEWFTGKFGDGCTDHYLFPFGKTAPVDPTRPTTTLKTSWSTVRASAGVECRLHDLRHTVATKMAENGVPESTMLALLGHMSRAMLERYSHIRMAAKRAAMDGLNRIKETPNPDGVATKSTTVATAATIQ